MNPSGRNILHVLSAAILTGATTACNASGDLAARAGDQELPVERLADIIHQWRPRVDSALARRVADWWVDYQLFAQRTVGGDSLLDSMTVREVLWPEARAYVLANWRKQLFASLPLDSAALDSVYRAGDYRWIQHLLIQAPSRAPAEAWERARRRAERLRERLERDLSWKAAQRYNEDATSRPPDGSVGIITRGQTEPEFDGAAFALAPGEISQVVASSYGFHIARRPPLTEVRDVYHSEVEPMVAEHFDSLYIRGLAARWRLELEPGGLSRARQAVQEPLRFKESRTVIARFQRGRFTLQDVVRWLQAVPDWMHIQVERDLEGGSDQQLSAFLNLMMGYELLYREALDHGVDITPGQFGDLKVRLTERLDRLKSALGVYPPGPGDSTSVAERERRAAEKVEQYFRTLGDDWRRFARVPPLLADRLRREARWAVYPRGVERSVNRANEMRASADITRERL